VVTVRQQDGDKKNKKRMEKRKKKNKISAVQGRPEEPLEE
jgi:hypothetical protein